MVTATTGAAVRADRDGSHPGVVGASLDHVAEVVDLGVGATGRDQENAVVAVLVDENIMEATGVFRNADAGDFFDPVRKIGDVENDRAHVRVRATLAKLQRLNDVVAVVPLEVLHVHAAGAEVQILVLDAPAIDDFGLRRIV